MSSLKKFYNDNLKASLANQYKVDKSEITDKDVEAYNKYNNLATANMLKGTTSMMGGGFVLKNVRDKGYLSGRRKLYHGTDKSNISNIKKEGLKAFGKNDNEAYWTNGVLSKFRQHGAIKDEPEKAVYLGKNKDVARVTNRLKPNAGPLQSDLLKPKRGIVEVNIPYNDYKEMKKKFVDNPELLGAKNHKEYGKLRDAFAESIGEKDKMNKVQRFLNYKNLNKNNVAVLPEDLPSKYIKGGEGYVKNTPKEVLNYIRTNPKRFAKGLGVTGIGGLMLAGGANRYLSTGVHSKKVHTDLNKLREFEDSQDKRKQKTASNYLDEMYMEKIAESDGIDENGREYYAVSNNALVRALKGQDYKLQKDLVDFNAKSLEENKKIFAKGSGVLTAKDLENYAKKLDDDIELLNKYKRQMVGARTAAVGVPLIGGALIYKHYKDKNK